MPTDPTVQTVAELQTSKTALLTPPAASTQPELTDEFIRKIPYDLLKKAHPDVQTIETRYAAAHQEIDGKKTKKELEAENAYLRTIAGVDKPIAPVASSQPVLQEQKPALDVSKIQEEIEWNIANKDQIKIAGSSYYEFLQKGYQRQDALDLALLRKPTSDKSISENLRAQISASPGSGGVDRSSEPGPIIEGVSREYIESMKARFPGISDASLITIIQRSVGRNQNLGS